jgi:hypothetical protein|tara:strand:+ start:14738 stop:14947 length:210 start_codon:yes stop_codon:yes gene_type:complete
MTSQITIRKKNSEYVLNKKEYKYLSVKLPIEVHIQIEQIKLDLRKNFIKNVMQDALNDYFKKYGYPPIA